MDGKEQAGLLSFSMSEVYLFIDKSKKCSINISA